MRKLLQHPLLWLALALLMALPALRWGFSAATAAACLPPCCIGILLAFGRAPATEILTVKLPPQLEEQLAATDFSARTVLVGTVRTPAQLQYCLDTRQYYVPARLLQGSPFPLTHIALHEEEVGTRPGIRHIGQIRAFAQLKRADIPVPMRPNADPEEPYCLYTLESWQQRQPAIRILDSSRGRPEFTCLFLLEHCSSSYPLFSVTCAEDFRLMYTLDRFCQRLQAAGSKPVSCALGGSCTITAKRQLVFVTDAQGCIRECLSRSHLLTHPKKLFERLQLLIK